MSGFESWEHTEYETLMSRGRDAERTAHFCWTAAGLVGSVLLSWAVAAKNPSLMLPVVFAAAFGFYAALHARQQVRLIAGYVKENIEPQAQGAQWFTRLGHMESVPGFNPSGDWAAAGLSNIMVIAAIALAWMYAGPAAKGELMAGMVTGLGLVFCFHSITETAHLRAANAAALWRQAGNQDERRGPRLAAR